MPRGIKITIDCKEMKRLYEKEFYTQGDLWTHFGVSEQVLRRHFKKCGIKARAATRFNIPFKRIEFDINKKREQVFSFRNKVNKCREKCEIYQLTLDDLITEEIDLLDNLEKELFKI